MQQPAFLARIWHKLYKRNRANCQRVRTGFGAPARTGFGTDFGTELAHEPFLCSSQGVSARFGGDMFLGDTAASSEDEGRRFFVAREFPMKGVPSSGCSMPTALAMQLRNGLCQLRQVLTKEEAATRIEPHLRQRREACSAHLR